MYTKPWAKHLTSIIIFSLYKHCVCWGQILTQLLRSCVILDRLFNYVLLSVSSSVKYVCVFAHTEKLKRKLEFGS